ncbi:MULTISPECIES: hypothetical protein [unclassified Curtobacterium]|uniref:hypothetical protein n=1 Tax=unclassified Curtobacterium TaxID=257496 RepID=UPI003814EF6C
MRVRRGIRGLGRSLPRSTFVLIATVVVALVLVDVVLVAIALGRTAPEQHGPAGPIPTFTSTPSSTEVPTPGVSGTPSASGDGAAAVSGHHLLSALDSLEAWRASSGSCSDAHAVLEHTVDGGATWVAVALGDDVRAVRALRATTAGLSVLGVIGDDCAPTVRTSVDDGVTWTDGKSGAAGAGIVDAAIQLSTGPIESPCDDPVDAYQGEYTSLVACERKVEWRGGAGSWVELPLPGVQGIADAGDTYTLARLGSSTCDGVQIASLPAARLDPGSQISPIGCWKDGGSDGPVAIDLAGTALWAWAGDSVAVSADGGASW